MEQNMGIMKKNIEKGEKDAQFLCKARFPHKKHSWPLPVLYLAPS